MRKSSWTAMSKTSARAARGRAAAQPRGAPPATAIPPAPRGDGLGAGSWAGGAFGGWSRYAREGKPVYCYNLVGLQGFKVEAETAIPSGEHQVRMEFACDGGGLGKGGGVTLYIDGDKVRRPGRRDRADALLGRRDQRRRERQRHALSDDYNPKDSAFIGRVRWVQIGHRRGRRDIDHLITPEERLRIAMARQ
jgi:hypothetical protein